MWSNIIPEGHNICYVYKMIFKWTSSSMSVPILIYREGKYKTEKINSFSDWLQAFPKFSI